jgi:DsbC/DsbD-like thiol-disulfide interchange protein
MGQGGALGKGRFATVTIHDPIVIFALWMFQVICSLMFLRVIAFLVALSSPAIAQVPDNLARAEVMTGWRDGATHVSGLSIRMAKGWHTYWRAPGDAGIPPSFNWSGSTNLKSVRVHFPVPEVYDTEGMRSIGYTDQVTFPLMIKPKDPSQPVTLRGTIDIGVCDEICVPVTLQVSASLPAGGDHHAGLAQLLKDRPARGGQMTCEITPIADGLRVVAMADVPLMQSDEIAVIETRNSAVWVSPPVLKRNGKRLQAVVEMVPPNAKPFGLARSDVRLTVISDGQAVEILGCS